MNSCTHLMLTYSRALPFRKTQMATCYAISRNIRMLPISIFRITLTQHTWRLRRVAHAWLKSDYPLLTRASRLGDSQRSNWTQRVKTRTEKDRESPTKYSILNNTEVQFMICRTREFLDELASASHSEQTAQRHTLPAIRRTTPDVTLQTWRRTCPPRLVFVYQHNSTLERPVCVAVPHRLNCKGNSSPPTWVTELR